MSESVQCVEYVRRSTGINIHGNACDWNDLASRFGYVVADKPVDGCAICFEPKAHYADASYGHVGKVIDFHSDGSHYTIKVRHANWPSRTYFEDCGCGNVSEKTFVVKKGDKSVHYIVKNHTDHHKHKDNHKKHKTHQKHHH